MSSSSHEPKCIKLTTEIEDVDEALLANTENIKKLRNLEMQQIEMNNRLGTIEYRSRCRTQEYNLIQEEIQGLRDTRRWRQWGIRQIDIAIRQGLARLSKLEDKMFQDMEKVRDLRNRSKFPSRALALARSSS
jgi:hypothetical protein